MTDTGMHITDINGSDGPFWSLYQETRRRDGILDDPDFVPFWFLEKLARNRIAEARVGLEKIGTPNAEPAFQALRNLENFLLGGGSLDEREQIVLGILGAQEEATRRELAEAGVSERFVGCRSCRRELGSNDSCDTCLGARTAHWLGDAFEGLVRSRPQDGRSHLLALTKALYDVTKDETVVIGRDWEDALPRVIRFWGGVVPLSRGRLVLSKAAAEAYLNYRTKTAV